jgi:peptidoglycan/LPS O-acetylase OafA/YrhL
VRLSSPQLLPHGSRPRSGDAGALPAERGGNRLLPFLPGLDGLRALAVIAVLLYHAEGWLPGGFLGVEVFFVISGYLITSLLLSERRQTGRTDLRAFWLRRARRLLPALFVLIVAVLVYALIFLPQEVAGLRGDALSGAGYVGNWYLIFENKSYFASLGRPSLLRHIWSLAIEEQFYLVWPVVFALVSGRLGRRSILVVAVAGAVASAVLMAVLYQPGGDPSRVYYGTDTRLSGLLIGAALACLWPAGRLHTWAQRLPGVPFDAMGLAGIAVLGFLFWQVNEFQASLYRGGFVVVAMTAAGVIAAVGHPRARVLRWLLTRQPLAWAGLRSYGIYLWHWPVFILTRPQLDVQLDGIELMALRLAIVAVLAEVSYRIIEMPVRGGALGRAWRALRRTQSRWRFRPQAQFGGLAVTAAGLFLVLGSFVASAEPPLPPSYLPVSSVHTSVSTASFGRTAADDDHLAHGAATPTPLPVATARPTVGRITAIGDSVMLGASDDLLDAFTDIDVDAAVGRHTSEAIDLLRAQRDAGRLGDVVVVHMGNNGTFSSDEFDEIMQVTAQVPRVVFVNVRVPRNWEGPNNNVLASGVQRYHNAVLVDWHTATADHPELLYDDGIHTRPSGAQLYSQLIARAILA